MSSKLIFSYQESKIWKLDDQISYFPFKEMKVGTLAARGIITARNYESIDWGNSIIVAVFYRTCYDDDADFHGNPIPSYFLTFLLFDL